MRIDDLETPAVLIDEAVMAANIARAQAGADAAGLAFRPHIKTHKLPEVAFRQLKAGAGGINCQKLSEAEIFAEAGCGDILITYNMIGASRLARLGALNRRVTLTVTADSAEVVAGLARAFGPEAPLAVLVECDTGGARCGVQDPGAALALARVIAAAPGLSFRGLLTYPAPGGEAAVEAFFAATMRLLAEAGLDCPIRSTGGTPGLFRAALVPSATEFRAGTYVWNDRKILSGGTIRVEDCAMTVLASVVSRPTPARAIIDAGSKVLSSDLLGLSGHGLIPGLPGAEITVLSEEHGHVDLSACTGPLPRVGDRLEIIPNHTCVVANLADHLAFRLGDEVTAILPVAARGRVW